MIHSENVNSGKSFFCIEFLMKLERTIFLLCSFFPEYAERERERETHVFRVNVNFFIIVMN